MAGADESDSRRAEAQRADAARRNNPMNRLVPYLDLFMRLDDAELSRLAGVEADMVATLRRQVVEISEGLAQYHDLLPRLADEELIRLTGASAKTVRFWRLCQPRLPASRSAASRAADVASRAEISAITPIPRSAPTPEREPPAPARDEAPTSMRRRTTGVDMQATMLASGAPAPSAQPVANWSHDSAGTSAATSITPPPHQVPIASWDTTSPTSGTETMVTPIGQSPESMWGDQDTPSETATMSVAAGQGRRAAPRPAARVDPSESQQAAARALAINGVPFPGYEGWHPGMASVSEDDPEFALADLDH